MTVFGCFAEVTFAAEGSAYLKKSEHDLAQ